MDSDAPKFSSKDAVVCRGVGKTWAAGTKRAHEALRDVDPGVRKTAAEAMVQWKPAGAVAALNQALDGEVDPSVAFAELRALVAFSTASGPTPPLRMYRSKYSTILRMSFSPYSSRRTRLALRSSPSPRLPKSSELSVYTDDERLNSVHDENDRFRRNERLSTSSASLIEQLPMRDRDKNDPSSSDSVNSGEMSLPALIRSTSPTL